MNAQTDLRSQIASAIHAAKLSHDPLAAVLECQLLVMDETKRIAQSLESQISKVSNAASRGAYQQVGVLVRTYMARYVLVAVGAIMAAMVLAGSAVHVWDGGFRTTCSPQKDGGIVCWYSK